MEVQPIVKHEPADKGMKWKSQSADEVGEEHDPLMGPGGGDELPLIWEPVRDVVEQVSGSPQFLDVSLRGGGDHPLASRSGHVWNGFTEKVRTWALELESVGIDKQRRKKAWVKMGHPYPFIEAEKTVRLPTFPLRIAYSPSATIDGTVGLHMLVLMRIPR